MRRLIYTPSFERALKKFVKRNAKLQKQVENTLAQMQENIFSPKLGTHKLTGNLQGTQSCSCGYDCRVLFSLRQDPETGSEVIVLLDIGKHDEVY